MGADAGSAGWEAAIDAAPGTSGASGEKAEGTEYRSNDLLPWWLMPGFMCAGALIWLTKRLAILGYARTLWLRDGMTAPPAEFQPFLHDYLLDTVIGLVMFVPGLAFILWLAWWQYSLRLCVGRNGLWVSRGRKSRFFPYERLEDIRFAPPTQLRLRPRPFCIQTADGVTKIGPWLQTSCGEFLQNLRRRIEESGIDPARFQALSPEIIEKASVRNMKSSAMFGWAYGMLLALLAHQFFAAAIGVAAGILKISYHLPLGVTAGILVASLAIGWSRVRPGESAKGAFLRARRKGLRWVLIGCVLSAIWVAGYVSWHVWH